MNAQVDPGRPQATGSVIRATISSGVVRDMARHNSCVALPEQQRHAAVDAVPAYLSPLVGRSVIVGSLRSARESIAIAMRSISRRSCKVHHGSQSVSPGLGDRIGQAGFQRYGGASEPMRSGAIEMLTVRRRDAPPSLFN